MRVINVICISRTHSHEYTHLRCWGCSAAMYQCCRQHYLIALPGYHQAIDRHGLSTCNRAAELHISTLNYALNSISRAARVVLLLFLLFSRLLFAQVLIALVRLCLPIYCQLLLFGGSIRIRCCTKEADGRCYCCCCCTGRERVANYCST